MQGSRIILVAFQRISIKQDYPVRFLASVYTGRQIASVFLVCFNQLAACTNVRWQDVRLSELNFT